MFYHPPSDRKSFAFGILFAVGILAALGFGIAHKVANGASLTLPDVSGVGEAVSAIMPGSFSTAITPEARKAYKIACEAIRQKLPADERAGAVFPELGEEGVRALPFGSKKSAGSFYRIDVYRGGKEWIAILEYTQHRKFLVKHCSLAEDINS